MFEEENSEVATEMRSVYHSPPVPMAVPWLVLTDEGKEEQLFYNLSERPNNTTYKRYIREMSPAWFRYFQSPSHRGWLIVYCHLSDDKYPESLKVKGGDCFLWDPVSLEKIGLPSLHSWITDSEWGIMNGVLSSPPIVNPTSDNDSVVFFVLAAVKDNEFKHTIVFCRPGDKEWRSQVLPEFLFAASITCFNGKLHLLCNHDKNMNMHLVIEKQLGCDDDMTLSMTVTKIPVEQDTLEFGINHEMELLESRDELFVVVIDYHLPTERRYEDITSFQVFRMNFSSMAWEKVKSLGDHVLFLGGRTKASCSAADLGLTRGHVYFTLPEDKTVYVFDLEDGTISIDMALSGSMEQCFQAEWLALAMPISYTKGNNRVKANEAETNIKTSLEGIDKKECNEKNEGKTETVKLGIWGSLDMDIIELIASYLHTVDYLHFRAVCKTHQSVASIVRKRTTRDISHATSLSPWLILHQNNEDCVYRFVNSMHDNETYFINLSEFLLDATIHCSKGGWLLMSKSCKRNLLFFFNPFTRDVIRLPEIPEIPNHSCDFERVSFSSIPTSSDCIVFAISGGYSKDVYTYSISRGDSYSWCIYSRKNTKSPSTFEEDKYLRFTSCRANPVFHDGRFYCLDSCGTLGVFGVHNGEHSWKVMDELVPACTSYRQSFLVECEGQLLSVFVTPLNKARPVQIFKLHASKKTKRLAWVKVRDLGNYMLFVSHTCCIAAIAPVSRMKNNVYFPRVHNNRIVFFSLDTCKYQTLFLAGSLQSSSSSSSSSFYSTKKHLYCTWIEPNWSGATAGQLVW